MNEFALMFGMIGMWETVAILAVVLVLFGAKKVPELAKGLGQGLKEFRKASQEIQDDLHRALDEPPQAPRRPRPRPMDQARVTEDEAKPESTASQATTATASPEDAKDESKA